MPNLGHFPHFLPLPHTRRAYLQTAGAGLLSLATGRLAMANAPATAGARLAADFDATAAVWLGYDAGHQELTAHLAEALAPFVRIKMLVRDAAAQADAWALLQRRGLNAGQIQFVLDPRAPFFVRDAAVFGLDGEDKAFIVDFKWTYYGWAQWCRSTLQGRSASSRPGGRAGSRVSDCERPDVTGAGELDHWLAEKQGWASFQSSLAMEGGGVESNGRGLLIANSALWRARNPGLTPAAIETEIMRLPGVRKVIWLPYGLAHDPLHRGTITGPYVGWGTGGHTDEFVRFANPQTVLLAWPDNAEARSHPVARLNLARMRANYDVLLATKDQEGNPLQIVKVPMPKTIERPIVLSADADTAYSEQWTAASFLAREGRRNGETVRQVATSSYLNFVVANQVVLLPDYVQQGTPPARQAQVRRIFESAFPGRTVQFIDTGHTNWFGGGMHCATLNEPLARA